MNLNIDTNPKIGSIEFYTKNKNYVESPSPRSLIKQRGMEFEQFRSYQPDDDASIIDWKASARSDDTLVRVYSEDISINILLLIDVSESMMYGTQEKAKIEYAIELALNIAYGAISYGDRVGVLMFNDGIVEAINFETGANHFSEILGRMTSPKNLGGNLNLEVALQGFFEIFSNTHLLIMISDFINFGEKLYQDIHAVVDLTDIIGIMVNDKTDVTLEGGPFYLHAKDPFSEDKGFTKANLRDYYKANMDRINKLNDFFLTTDNDLWVFYCDDPMDKIMYLNTERNNLKK